MAGESFSVDTDGLHNQLPYLRELAARFKGVGTDLEAKLGAVGEPWGTDEPGQQFLESYAGPHLEILNGISTTGEVLDSTGDGIETMAKNFQILEDQNISGARSLDSGGSTGDPGHTRPGGTPEKP